MAATWPSDAVTLLQEALHNQHEPGHVLSTAIWRLAGQLLLNVPDCPAQLAHAVHPLMGRDPPPALLGNPVQQVSDREAHTTEHCMPSAAQH